MLTRELEEGEPGFTYRQLGERLQRVKQRKDASDEAAEKRLRELQEIAEEAAQTKEEPERLNLTNPGEYGLFTVLRAHAQTTMRLISLMRAADGRTSANESASNAGLEQL